MKGLAIALAVVFVVLVVLAVLHPFDTSGITRSLGLSNDKPHIKHAVLYAILALLCLVWFRFQNNATSLSR